jgi:hypothetical protein
VVEVLRRWGSAAADDGTLADDVVGPPPAAA